MSEKNPNMSKRYTDEFKQQIVDLSCIFGHPFQAF